MSTSVTRRSALTAAAVAVAGGIAGFVYGRNSDAAKAPAADTEYTNPYGGSSSGNSSQPITTLDKVPIGGGVITHGVVVTRESADVVHAYSSKCTHLGCTVNRVKSGKIFCPCHGSVFNANTGAVEQGPAPSPLPPVQVTIKDGGIYPG